MKISLIAAVAANGVIGRDNDMPWHLPDDSTFFKSKIKGHVVIVGRKSFEAMDESLPYLWVVVTSQNSSNQSDHVKFVHSFDDALAVATRSENEEVFVIGGAKIYAAALPIARKMYLTEIHESYQGDTYFPNYNRFDWREVSRIIHPVDRHHEVPFDFVTYERL